MFLHPDIPGVHRDGMLEAVRSNFLAGKLLRGERAKALPLSFDGVQGVYTLDIETIRQVMQKYKRTGYLRAELPAKFHVGREPCYVEIVLEAGNFVSCSIFSSRGLLFTGNKAYQELARLGRLHWDFVPRSPAAAQPGLDPRMLESRPCRIVVEQQLVRSWPPSHKLVYELADGTRSVKDMAELLSASPQTVTDILRDLRSIRAIE